MNLRKKYQVLVLMVASLSLALWGIAGCAGVAEPLPSLSVTPNVLSVSAKVGTSSSEVVSVTNIGATPVSVTQAIVTGTGFTMTGLTTPLSLAPKQSQSFNVKFAAAKVGSVNGSLALMTDLQHRAVVVSLHGSAATASPSVASVSVVPAAVSPAPGAHVQFSAAVQGTTTNDTVTWKATAGSISSTGMYTAPMASTSGTVTATSVADPTKSASAVVTVAAASSTPTPPSLPAVASVTVTPAATSLATGGKATFTATVAGTTTNKAVSWKAALGTITAAGAYTAPAKAGTDTVTATSAADSTKVGVATITVTAAPTNPTTPTVSSVTVTPAATSLATGGKATFTATVAGTTTNKAVSWKAALGTITAAGAYTAPAKAGTDTVTATSAADSTKVGVATITVTAAPTNPTTPAVRSVTVTPAATSLATGGKATFTATVAGTTTNKAVSWKAALGTITAAGAYTAPAKAGTDTVTATSAADSTKVGVATITVTAAPTNPTTPTVSSVTVSPSPAKSITGGTLTFAASVAGSTTNKAVTWKATLGSITGAGFYTAPAKAGTDTVTATSVADSSKSGSTSVTVTAAAQPPAASVTGVTISPKSASATTGGTLQFSASVQGSETDKSVSWKAAVGSISTSGLYTASGHAGSDTVTATSNADSTKSASAQVSISAPVAHSGALPAFPQAQGGGAGAAGGRGGAVMEVTNLNDSGTGSLRSCVQASGPRHCVFRVAGLIPVTSGDLTVNSPFLSIDGQTAPGQIILGGPNTRGEVLRISTHDVVVRYVTVSPDNYNTPSGPNTGTVGLSTTNCDCYNIVIDHVSTRWAGNKMLISVDNYVAATHNISFQWSMLYEPHAMHPVGPGTSANPVGCPNAGANPDLPNPCFSTQETNIDYHHSFFANIDHRIPENGSKSNSWVSNITYNWSFYANEFLGASTIDVVNSVFKPGNLNAGAQTYPIHFSGNLSASLPNGTPSDYVVGNICRGDSSPASDQWGRCTQQISGENGSETGPVPDSWKRDKPDPRTFPVTSDPASTLDDLLVPTVGNSQHLDCTGNWVSHRDAADSRVINQFKTGGSGGFWPNGVTVAGPSSIPPPNSNYQDHPITGFSACTESMHDGIPDQWKQMKGLSTSDPNLHKEIAPNGYTWLENYLNNQ